MPAPSSSFAASAARGGAPLPAPAFGASSSFARAVGASAYYPADCQPDAVFASRWAAGLRGEGYGGALAPRGPLPYAPAAGADAFAASLDARGAAVASRAVEARARRRAALHDERRLGGVTTALDTSPPASLAAAAAARRRPGRRQPTNKAAARLARERARDDAALGRRLAALELGLRRGGSPAGRRRRPASASAAAPSSLEAKLLPAEAPPRPRARRSPALALAEAHFERAQRNEAQRRERLAQRRVELRGPRAGAGGRQERHAARVAAARAAPSPYGAEAMALQYRAPRNAPGRSAKALAQVYDRMMRPQSASEARDGFMQMRNYASEGIDRAASRFATRIEAQLLAEEEQEYRAWGTVLSPDEAAVRGRDATTGGIDRTRRAMGERGLAWHERRVAPPANFGGFRFTSKAHDEAAAERNAAALRNSMRAFGDQSDQSQPKEVARRPRSATPNVRTPLNGRRAQSSVAVLAEAAEARRNRRARPRSAAPGVAFR